jgi:hypothetical protein
VCEGILINDFQWVRLQAFACFEAPLSDETMQINRKYLHQERIIKTADKLSLITGEHRLRNAFGYLG